MKEDRFKAAKILTPAIPAKSTDVWQNRYLTVPSLPPSGLMFCNIINIDHYMTVGRLLSQFRI